MIVGWTGHRPDVFASPRDAIQRVEAWADRVRPGQGDLTFLSGGQRGVDTWAARAAIRRGIPFELVLPVAPGQFAQDWSEEERAGLEKLLSRARLVRIADEDGRLGSLAYDYRNEFLAKRSDLVVAVWTGLRQGGTFYTLCAAAAFGTRIESSVLPAAPGISLSGRGV